jgi:HEPN domain-containing protein
MDKEIQSWLRYAQSDMTAAEMLHAGGEYMNAIFHLQQAVEKTLKALLLRQTKVQPPRIHGLRGLSERCHLRLSEKQELLIENLSEYYVESRYPGDWNESPPEVLAKEVGRLIPATKEFIEWLESQI